MKKLHNATVIGELTGEQGFYASHMGSFISVEKEDDLWVARIGTKRIVKGNKTEAARAAISYASVHRQ